MFINDRNNFLLLENIKQAKQYLQKMSNEYEDFIDRKHSNYKGTIWYNEKGLDDSSAFKEIVDTLKRFPNLVDTFTRMLVYPTTSVGRRQILHVQGDFREFHRIVEWITNNKQIVNQLPKNIVKYTSLEEIADDIVQLGIKRKIEKFKKSLYRSMRDRVNRLQGEDMKRFNDLALQFTELDDGYKDQFTPMGFFEHNDISLEEFTESLDKFINRKDVNEEKKRILKYIEDNKIDVQHNEHNVVVIQTNDKEHIIELGSQKWCIVYQADYYHKTYLSESTFNTQYIIFNFNLPTSNKNSMFGITIRPDGEVYANGTCQNKPNHQVPLDDIYTMTRIPKDSLVSKYKEKYEKTNKEATEIKKSISEGDFSKFSTIYKSIKDRKDLFNDGRNMRNDPFAVNLSVKTLFIDWIENQDNIVDVMIDIKKSPEIGRELLSQFETESNQRVVKSVKTRRMSSFDKMKDVIDILPGILSFESLSTIVLNSIVPEDVLYFIDSFVSKNNIKLDDFHKNEHGVTSIDVVYLTHFIYKRGWKEFANYLEKIKDVPSLTMKLISQKSNYRDYIPAETTFSKEQLKSIEITIDEYNKIIEIDHVKKSPFRDYMITYLVDIDKLLLVVRKDYSMFSGFHDHLYRTMCQNYLSELKNNVGEIDMELVCHTINNMAKQSNIFMENFETSTSSGVRKESILTNIADYVRKNDLYNKILKYPFLFKSLKNNLNIAVLITGTKVSLEEEIKIEWATKSIVNSNSYVGDIYHDHEQISHVWDNLDKIIGDLVIDITESDFSISASPEKIKEVLRTKIKKDLFARINKMLDGSDFGEYKTFDAYYKSFNLLLPIIKEAKSEDGDSLEDYIDISNLVRHWAEEERGSYIGKKDMFPEISLIDFVNNVLKEKEIFDLLDSNELYETSNLDNDDYVELCAEIIEKSGIEIDEYTPNGVLYALTTYGDGNYGKLYNESIGLKYDEENKVWYYETDYDELGDLYTEKFHFEDDGGMDWYSGDNNYSAHSDGWVDHLDLANLELIAKHFKSAGFDIDITPLDKYTIFKKNDNGYNVGMSYKESMEHYREDKELSKLLSDVESIIGEGYEDETGDLYSNIAYTEIQDVIDRSYESADADARRNEFWNDQVGKLDELFDRWPESEKHSFGNRMFKWDSEGKSILVIPNDSLTDKVDLYYITDFESTESFMVKDLIGLYIDDNGSISWADDPGYASWDNDNYEYFNERIYDDLYGELKEEDKKTNESIVKYKNFISRNLK